MLFGTRFGLWRMVELASRASIADVLQEITANVWARGLIAASLFLFISEMWLLLLLLCGWVAAVLRILILLLVYFRHLLKKMRSIQAEEKRNVARMVRKDFADKNAMLAFGS